MEQPETTTLTLTLHDDGQPWDGQPVELIALAGMQIDAGRLFIAEDGEQERLIVLPLDMLDLLGQDAALRLLTGLAPEQVDDPMGLEMAISVLHYTDRPPLLRVVYRWEAGDGFSTPAGISPFLWSQRIPATWFGLHPDSPPVPGGMVVPAAKIGSGEVYGCGQMCRTCYEVNATPREDDAVKAAMQQIIALTERNDGFAETLRQIADLAAWAGGITA